MSVAVLQGDARRLPLPDGCVDLIVTSPPYFGLRDYRDGDGSLAGQIGSEAMPQEWLEALWECTAEWVRVLKPEGSIFVNLGDKYVADNRGSGVDAKRGQAKHAPAGPLGYLGRDMARHKSLLGLPWRYAIGCTDRLGLILRAEIVWSKTNGLPESVTDRVRRSHEQVFHFTRQPRYYAAVDEIREPQKEFRSGPNGGVNRRRVTDQLSRKWNPAANEYNPLGKLPGSVWEIPSAPLQVPERVGVDHFAAFPPALVRPLVLGWSPPGVCTVCGHGRRPVVDGGRNGDGAKPHKAAMRVASFDWAAWKQGEPHRITGYACACPQPGAPTTPALVLDPFMGTGTTLLVASAYGRRAVGTDLSRDYCRLACWRTTDPGERARARDLPKPPPIPPGMEPLFEMGAM